MEPLSKCKEYIVYSQEKKKSDDLGRFHSNLLFRQMRYCEQVYKQKYMPFIQVYFFFLSINLKMVFLILSVLCIKSFITS